mmetsp:Transcript_7049/g.19883  ORF Transcript_7049/g.19883 Transcript_7049/m.19883 type:complete len:209 (+) Transcript_7049:208-834(+)
MEGMLVDSAVGVQRVEQNCIPLARLVLEAEVAALVVNTLESLEAVLAFKREHRLPTLLHRGEINQHCCEPLAGLRAVGFIKGVVVRIIVLAMLVVQQVEGLPVLDRQASPVSYAVLDLTEHPFRVMGSGKKCPRAGPDVPCSCLRFPLAEDEPRLVHLGLANLNHVVALVVVKELGEQHDPRVPAEHLEGDCPVLRVAARRGVEGRQV